MLSLVQKNDLFFSSIRSKIAYENHSTIRNINQRMFNINIKHKTDDHIYLNYKATRLLYKTNTILCYHHNKNHGFICCTDDVLYLTFRGTNEFEDIIRNIDIRHYNINNSNRLVHNGFHER